MPGVDAHQGVLVGLTSGRTLWVAWPNDTARVVTEEPHLLVPRDDGLWWAGVVTRCEVGEGGGGWVEDTIFVDRTDAVFVTRAGEEARVPLDGTTCDAAEQEVLDLRTRARKDAPPRDSLELEQELNPETFYCSIYSRRITFASPAVLSIEKRNMGTEFCSLAKYSTSGENVVTAFTSDTRVALRPLLSKDVSARLERLFSDSTGCADPAEDPGRRVDSTWAIRRRQGAWVARIWMDGPVVCRGGQETEGGEPLLPHSFTGDSPLPMTWSELVRQIPNATDAISSPSADYILVQRADSLMLFRSTDRQLGSPLLSVHIGYYEELAMVRWATPDEARRWNATLPALEPPRVKVVPRER
jgi:hypothetical protein